MKTFTKSVLLLCSLLFAASCEKASVAPELSASSSQDAAPAKDRGIETRVTGRYNNANFTATLRINSFNFGTYGLAVFGKMQQIGGGLSRADVATLESTPISFTVNQIVNEWAYRSFYWNNVNDATAVYPFDVANESFTLSLSPYATMPAGMSLTLGALDAAGNFSEVYTPVVLSAAVTPRFNKVSALVAALPTVFDRHNTSFVNSYNGELLPDAYRELGTRLDAIADVVGRY